MSKLTAKEATERALCKICNHHTCALSEYWNCEQPKYPGCMLRSLVIKEWMADLMGFE
jgi:hypothetical protein